MSNAKTCVSCFIDESSSPVDIESHFAGRDQAELFGEFITTATQALWLNHHAEQKMYDESFSDVLSMLALVTTGHIYLQHNEQCQKFKRAFLYAAEYLEHNLSAACDDESLIACGTAQSWFSEKVSRPQGLADE